MIERLIGKISKAMLIPLAFAGCSQVLPEYIKTSYEKLQSFVMDPNAEIEWEYVKNFRGTEPVRAILLDDVTASSGNYFRYLGGNEFAIDPNLTDDGNEIKYTLDEKDELISDKYRIVIDDINNYDWDKFAEVSFWEIKRE